MKDKTDKGVESVSPIDRTRRQRITEGWATAGLLLLALGIAGPFFSVTNPVSLSVFKWLYVAGALIYTVARMLATRIKGDTLRVRRFRRMEVWAGWAFCIGAFFWFYNTEKFGSLGFGLKVISETVTFTLAGAVIQIIASWLLSSALRKEVRQAEKAASVKDGGASPSEEKNGE